MKLRWIALLAAVAFSARASSLYDGSLQVFPPPGGNAPITTGGSTNFGSSNPGNPLLVVIVGF